MTKDIKKAALNSLLVTMDRKNAKRKDYNPYALGLYLTAAETVHDAKSFAEAFNPTRGIHWVAKQMGYALDVDKGNWILGDD